MQTLLNDIELDVQELKCLVQAVSDHSNPALRTVARRNIRQMQMRLEALSELLAEPVVAAPAEPMTPTITEPITVVEPLEPTPVVSSFTSSSTSPILAECIKPAKDLRHAISLNDSFRFARELFDGDAARMNEVVRQLSETSSFDQALDVFHSTVRPDEENVAATDFIELLKKYFS